MLDSDELLELSDRSASDGSEIDPIEDAGGTRLANAGGTPPGDDVAVLGRVEDPDDPLRGVRSLDGGGVRVGLPSRAAVFSVRATVTSSRSRSSD